MSSQATANARLHHLRSSEISSRARERTATAAPTHSGRRLTYQGGIALDLTGSASHELVPIPRVLPKAEHTCFSVTGVQSKACISSLRSADTLPRRSYGRPDPTSSWVVIPHQSQHEIELTAAFAVLDVELLGGGGVTPSFAAANLLGCTPHVQLSKRMADRLTIIRTNNRAPRKRSAQAQKWSLPQIIRGAILPNTPPLKEAPAPGERSRKWQVECPASSISTRNLRR